MIVHAHISTSSVDFYAHFGNFICILVFASSMLFMHCPRIYIKYVAGIWLVWQFNTSFPYMLHKQDVWNRPNVWHLKCTVKFNDLITFFRILGNFFYISWLLSYKYTNIWTQTHGQMGHRLGRTCHGQDRQKVTRETHIELKGITNRGYILWYSPT